METTGSCACDHHHHDEHLEGQLDEGQQVNERTIVVAIDDSGHSFHALEWALDTLISPPAIQPCKVVLLHAKMFPATIAGGPGLIIGADLIKTVEESRDREIETFMSKALSICEQRKVKADIMVCPGDPRDVICDVTQKLNANYLVLGSHSYGAIKRTVLGSVSDYCAHHAKCPIVIVKKPHKKHNHHEHDHHQHEN